MELQDFLDQHNDLCEVCNQGGDLLCCNTCNLVFHLHCSRPKLTKMPADIWNCSFCIASGVTGHKRESRVRRRASSAVREMLRLKRSLPYPDNDDDKHSVASSNSMHSILDDDTRHQNKNDMSPKNYHNFTEKDQQIEECMEIDEQEKNMTPVKNKKIKQEDNTSMIINKIDAEEDSKSKEKNDMILEMTSNSTGPDEDKEDDVVTDTVDLDDSTNKRKRDTEENVVESEDGKEGPTRKMRRLRRQPIMYDPQTCAASEWQSDGVFEWKTLSPSERGVPNRQLSIGTTTEEARRKSTLDIKAREISKAKHVDDGNHDEENNHLRDSIWCNFCRDDPTIPVCCFCGCRNCFGKHNKVNRNLGIKLPIYEIFPLTLFLCIFFSPIY
jgi:PHD-finger